MNDEEKANIAEGCAYISMLFTATCAGLGLLVGILGSAGYLP